MENIIFENKEYNLSSEQKVAIMEILGISKRQLSDVDIGKTFKIAGIEFIHLGEGRAVAKYSLFTSDFGESNNFSESKVFRRLKEEILPNIVKEVGEENLLEFETDLTALNGSEEYGKIKSKISLPTIDFYRANYKVLKEHLPDKWAWTATPNSTPECGNDNWILCVSPSGSLDFSDCNYVNGGVRPFCIFNSSIFVSC